MTWKDKARLYQMLGAARLEGRRGLSLFRGRRGRATPFEMALVAENFLDSVPNQRGRAGKDEAGMLHDFLVGYGAAAQGALELL